MGDNLIEFLLKKYNSHMNLYSLDETGGKGGNEHKEKFTFYIMNIDPNYGWYLCSNKKTFHLMSKDIGLNL